MSTTRTAQVAAQLLSASNTRALEALRKAQEGHYFCPLHMIADAGGYDPAREYALYDALCELRDAGLVEASGTASGTFFRVAQAVR